MKKEPVNIINSPKTVNILIADDHPVVCLALKNIFSQFLDLNVVAEARNGKDAVRLANELHPDIVILDISMPLLNGLEATRQIKHNLPNTLVLIFTVHTDSEHVLGILEAGADGYLTKDALDTELVQTVRSLISGEAVLSPDIFKQVLRHALRYPYKSSNTGKAQVLTQREQEILGLALQGFSNKNIALQLNVSASTIKTHFVEIFNKLNVSSRTEAVISALKAGVVHLD